MEITIRRATPGDAPRLTEIARSAKAHWGYPAEWLALWEPDLTVSPAFIDRHQVYGAVAGGRIVGFYGLVDRGHTAELEHLWVLPDAMGHGVGRALFRHASRRMESLGSRVMRIVSDPNAEPFYRRMGARRTGEQDSIPAGRRIPVLAYDPGPKRGYYAARLAGRRLQRCYEIAPPRVQQYLEEEILHAASRLRPADRVLELGCGYGRVARRLAAVARRVVGIDTAEESLRLARALEAHDPRCDYAAMDALALGFPDGSFDAVVCLQNGIGAFGADPTTLLREALRVTRPGGRALFSTYADAFWPERLAWFRAQASEGLVGAVDLAASGGGTIVCADGFRAVRLAPGELRAACAPLGVVPAITEVDRSSVFCEILKPAAGP